MWITGSEDPRKQVVDVKEREIVKVGLFGKVKSREHITEVYKDDGKVLDQRVRLIQNAKRNSAIRMLRKIPWIKKAEFLKVTEHEGNKVTIETSTGEVLHETL